MAATRKPKKLNAEGLWDYALRLLGSRAHSTGELRRKLALRAELASDVGLTLRKLEEYQLSDDRKFSESLASSRLADRGWGRFRVLRELRAKQVSAPIAEKAVNDTFAGTDEDELAEKYLLRKYRGKDLTVFLSEEKNVAAAYRRLRTGGFRGTVALAVLKRHSGRSADWDISEEEAE